MHNALHVLQIFYKLLNIMNYRKQDLLDAADNSTCKTNDLRVLYFATGLKKKVIDGL